MAKSWPCWKFHGIHDHKVSKVGVLHTIGYTRLYWFTFHCCQTIVIFLNWSFSSIVVGLGDISFLHRYRNFTRCDMHIAVIAILVIMKKCVKTGINSQTIQLTDMADPIFESLPHKMNKHKRFQYRKVQINCINTPGGEVAILYVSFHQVNSNGRYMTLTSLWAQLWNNYADIWPS